MQASKFLAFVFKVLIFLFFQKGGPYLAIYLWAFMFILSLVMMTIYPVLIAPLFNKFTPVSSSLMAIFKSAIFYTMLLSDN